jgi:quinol monooxygenase YgiN
MVTVHNHRRGEEQLVAVRAATLPSSLVWLATILVVFSFAVLQLGLRGGPGGIGIHAFSLETSKAAEETEFFSLMVELQFSNEAAKHVFLQEIAPLADHVEKNERAGTLTYQVLQSDKDPLHVLMMERYVDKEQAYLRVHKQSTAFLAFRPKLQALQDAGKVAITGHSYSDTRIGFAHRVVVGLAAGTAAYAAAGGGASVGDGAEQ